MSSRNAIRRQAAAFSRSNSQRCYTSIGSSWRRFRRRFRSHLERSSPGLCASLIFPDFPRSLFFTHICYIDITAPAGYEGPLILNLKPVQVFSAAHASSTLFCTMSWSPVGSCERIAAGSHNGMMAVFRLTDDPVARAEKILALSPWGLSLEDQASAASKQSNLTAEEQPVQKQASKSDDEGLEWDVPFEPVPFMTYVRRLVGPSFFCFMSLNPLFSMLLDNLSCRRARSFPCRAQNFDS